MLFKVLKLAKNFRSKKYSKIRGKEEGEGKGSKLNF